MVIAARLLALLLLPWAGFSADVWPGEGIPVLQAITPELALYSEPSRTSPARNHPVVPNTPLTWDRSLYRTERPGLLAVTSGGRLRGFTLPGRHHLTRDDFYLKSNRSLQLRLKRGELLVYLQYVAEGGCLVGYRGKPFLLERCPQLSLENLGPPELVVRGMDSNEPAFSPLLKASTQWWVRLVDGKNRPIGWIPVQPSTEVRVTGRTF
jgi:hypothetical protein